jgi:hypothetical protein
MRALRRENNMKNKIKAWLLWNWDDGCPFDDDGDGNGKVFFDKETGEENSAMPVIIQLTKQGLKDQVENDIAKQKNK